MKKFISIISLVAVVFSMCSMSAFAALPHTLTMACSDADGVVAQGDEFVVTASIGTTEGLRAIQAQIVFDPADIEIGMSESAKDILGDYDSESYETFDDYCIAEGDGCASYVDSDYFSTYGALKSAAKFGDPTIGYEVKEDGKGYVSFVYAKSGTAAVSSSNAKIDLAIAGVVLKVKTSEKKSTTITVVGKGNGTDMEVTNSTVANSITLNLNGYVPGPQGPTATTVGSASDEGIQEYSISTGEKVMLSPKYTNQVITEATRFVVTYKGETRIFGSDIYEKLEGTGGEFTVGSLTFGLIVTDSTAVASDFTFEIQ